MEQNAYRRQSVSTFQVFFCVFIIHVLLYGCGYSFAEPVEMNSISTGKDWERVPCEHMRLPENSTLKRDAENGTIIFLQGNNLSENAEQDQKFRELQTMAKFAEVALTFIDCYKSLYRIQEPFNELTVETVNKDDRNFKHIRLQQVYKGLKVLSSQIIVHLNKGNHVYLVQGRYSPTPRNFNITPVLNEDDAFAVVASVLGRSDIKSRDCTFELVVFNSSSLSPHLAYRILVQASVMNGLEFIIDAHTGKILEKLSTTYTQEIRGKIQ